MMIDLWSRYIIRFTHYNARLRSLRHNVTLTVLFCRFLTLHSNRTGCPTSPVIFLGVLASKYGASADPCHSWRNSALKRREEMSIVELSKGSSVPEPARTRKKQSYYQVIRHKIGIHKFYNSFTWLLKKSVSTNKQKVSNSCCSLLFDTRLYLQRKTHN